MRMLRRTSRTKTTRSTVMALKPLLLLLFVTCAIPAVVEGFSTSLFLNRRRHFTNQPKTSFRHASPLPLTKRDSVLLQSHHYGDCLSNIAHGGEVGGAFGSKRFGSASSAPSSSFLGGDFPGCSSFLQEQEQLQGQNTPQEKEATHSVIRRHRHQRRQQQLQGEMDDVPPIMKRKQDWMHSISNRGHDQLYHRVMTETSTTTTTTTTTTSKFSDKNDKDTFVEGTTNEESPQVVDNAERRIFVVPPSAASSSAASADVAPPEETSLEEKSLETYHHGKKLEVTSQEDTPTTTSTNEDSINGEVTTLNVQDADYNDENGSTAIVLDEATQKAEDEKNEESPIVSPVESNITGASSTAKREFVAFVARANENRSSREQVLDSDDNVDTGSEEELTVTATASVGGVPFLPIERDDNHAPDSKEDNIEATNTMESLSSSSSLQIDQADNDRVFSKNKQVEEEDSIEPLIIKDNKALMHSQHEEKEDAVNGQSETATSVKKSPSSSSSSSFPSPPLALSLPNREKKGRKTQQKKRRNANKPAPLWKTVTVPEISSSIIRAITPEDDVNRLHTRDEYRILAYAASHLARSVVHGGEAAVRAVGALLDAIAAENVADAVSDAVDSTLDAGRILSRVAATWDHRRRNPSDDKNDRISERKGTGDELVSPSSVESVPSARQPDESRGVSSSNDNDVTVNAAVLETCGDILASVGAAAASVLYNLASSESSRAAAAAASESAHDIVTACGALAVLGRKQADGVWRHVEKVRLDRMAAERAAREARLVEEERRRREEERIAAEEERMEAERRAEEARLEELQREALAEKARLEREYKAALRKVEERLASGRGGKKSVKLRVDDDTERAKTLFFANEL